MEKQPGTGAHLSEHVLGIAVLVIEAARLVAAAVFMDVDANAVHGHAQVGKRDVGKTAQRAPAHGLEADTAQDRLAAHGDALRRNGGMLRSSSAPAPGGAFSGDAISLPHTHQLSTGLRP